jgi:hypothetical protein
MFRVPSSGRKSFTASERTSSTEQEYRLTLRLDEKERENNIRGRFVPVLLDKLIDKVYVSPTAPTWVAEVVRNVAEKYNLDVHVIQSDLYAPVVK